MAEAELELAVLAVAVLVAETVLELAVLAVAVLVAEAVLELAVLAVAAVPLPDFLRNYVFCAS